MNGKNKILLAILGVIIVVLLGFFAINPKKEKVEIIGSESLNYKTYKDGKFEEIPEEQPKKELQILDLNSKTRPIAVMINNHPQAVAVQSGLQDAYLVYEMQVEYGLTRMMALFKDKNTAKIGSVRSSRHNYLDYVMENDAVYVHFGYSDIAEKQIPQLGINNINGLYDGAFWRDTTLNVAYEHTAFTNIEKVMADAKAKGYRTESDKKTLLNYSVEEIALKDEEKSIEAKEVILNYSLGTVVKYVYDESTKTYKRYINGNANIDYVTKKQYTMKNIIVVKVQNTLATGSTYLQDYKNIGTGDGYYITNGYAIPIKWSKESRSSQTIYKDLNGKEITVNDGNTYIGLIPLGNSAILK